MPRNITSCAASLGDPGWAYDGGDANGDRFSRAHPDQRAANVGKLQSAWRIDDPPGRLQTTPLIIAGALYG